MSAARLLALAGFMACLVLAVAAQISYTDNFLRLIGWAAISAGVGGIALACEPLGRPR